MRRLTWGRGVKLTLGCRERCGHQRARSSCVHERVCVKFRPTLWFIHSVPLAFIISYKRSVWCIITNLLLCIFVISCRILQTLERMLTADWQEDQKKKKKPQNVFSTKKKTPESRRIIWIHPVFSANWLIWVRRVMHSDTSSFWRQGDKTTINMLY